MKKYINCPKQEHLFLVTNIVIIIESLIMMMLYALNIDCEIYKNIMLFSILVYTIAGTHMFMCIFKVNRINIEEIKRRLETNETMHIFKKEENKKSFKTSTNCDISNLVD